MKLNEITAAKSTHEEESIGWYVVDEHDKVFSGPFVSKSEAKHDMRTKQWFKSSVHDFAHGWVDDNDKFHDMEPDA